MEHTTTPSAPDRLVVNYQAGALRLASLDVRTLGDTYVLTQHLIALQGDETDRLALQACALTSIEPVDPRYAAAEWQVVQNVQAFMAQL